jgi:hypothetical protein
LGATGPKARLKGAAKVIQKQRRPSMMLNMFRRALLLQLCSRPVVSTGPRFVPDFLAASFKLLPSEVLRECSHAVP